MTGELGEVHKVSILPSIPSRAMVISNKMAVTEPNFRLNKSLV